MQTFIEEKVEGITTADIARIEEFFGRNIDELVESYGLSAAELLRGIERQSAESERQEREREIQAERQKEIDATAEEFRQQSEQRFKAIAKSQFLEANREFEAEKDFERLYLQIRDERLLQNFRDFVAKEVDRRCADTV